MIAFPYGNAFVERARRIGPDLPGSSRGNFEGAHASAAAGGHQTRSHSTGSTPGRFADFGAAHVDPTSLRTNGRTCWTSKCRGVNAGPFDVDRDTIRCNTDLRLVAAGPESVSFEGVFVDGDTEPCTGQPRNVSCGRCDRVNGEFMLHRIGKRFDFELAAVR